jgi:plastocyanin
MPRRSSRRVGSRALALIVIAIGAQLGAGEIAAATADDTAPPPGQGEPTVTQQLAAEDATAPDPAADPASAAVSAATAAPAPPPAASSSVTVSRAKASGTHTVSIVDFAFDPTALSVKLGDTVQWINNGTADEGHNVIGDGLSSPVLHTGESYSFTFTTAGTYSYICTIHPKMTGTVEVIDPNADEPKPKKTKKGSSKRGSSSAGTSASGGGSSGTSGAASSATGSGSESAAGRSADAAGTSGSLPSTGFRSLSLGMTGLALLALGLALRSVDARRLQRRS